MAQSSSLSGEAPKAHPAVSLLELQLVTADIKNTLSAAIADLWGDFQAMVLRVEEVESVTVRHDASLVLVHQVPESHAVLLRDLNRQVEDLDNRGLRKNLPLRGIPESVEHQNLPQAVSNICNNLLGRPPDASVLMERIHRALRPRGRDNDPPWDVICCIADFQLKEDVLRNARLRQHITFQGADIKLYQDLSNITLQRRRELRPLLEELRSRAIVNRWKFPFGLFATSQGRTALLRVPEDVDHFFETLGIPFVHLPDWYSKFRIMPLHRATSMEGIQVAGNFGIGRRQAQPPASPPGRGADAPHNGSPTASPAHRRARHMP